MEADLDRDGKISFDEFTKMVENTDVSMSMTLGTLSGIPRPVNHVALTTVVSRLLLRSTCFLFCTKFACLGRSSMAFGGRILDYWVRAADGVS